MAICTIGEDPEDAKSRKPAVPDFLFPRNCYISPLKIREELMKRNQIENQVLPGDWSQVIDQVQAVLTQTEKAAGERAGRLIKEEPIPPKEKATAWAPTLEHLE
jgi:hypothetical protein